MSSILSIIISDSFHGLDTMDLVHTRQFINFTYSALFTVNDDIVSCFVAILFPLHLRENAA